MPINAQIPLQVRGLQMPNFLGMYQQAQQIRENNANRKLRTRQEKFRESLGAGLQSTGGDYRKTLTGLQNQFPMMSRQMMTEVNNQEETQRRRQIAEQQRKQSIMSQYARSYLSLAPEQKIEQFDNLRMKLREQGIPEPPTWQEKTEYDPDVEFDLSSTQPNQGNLPTDRTPMSVLEHEYYMKLPTQKQKAAYLEMKRAPRVFSSDVGGQPSLVTPGIAGGQTEVETLSGLEQEIDAESRKAKAVAEAKVTGVDLQKEGREQEKWNFKKGQEDEKKFRRLEGKGLAGQTVVEDLGRSFEIIEKHEKKTIPRAAGFVGSIAKKFPETDAQVLSEHLSSIKSNISIDRLQAMREASPTGGALGQVPVQQQEYLMSLLGSLKQSQRDDVLKENIKRIFNIYMDIVHGYGNGPKRAKLRFDELGRSLKGDREWSNVWMKKAGGLGIKKPSTNTNAIKAPGNKKPANLTQEEWEEFQQLRKEGYGD